MAISEQAGESQVDPSWPYRHFSTWELVDLLKQAYEAGQPYDDALVFEVANRAIEGERGGPAARVEGPLVVDTF